MKKFTASTQKGISVYLAVIIMIVILSIVLGLTAILINQMRMVREMGYSVVAFYAADSGIEKALSVPADPDSLPEPFSGTLGNQAQYSVQYLYPGGDCDADVGGLCIESVGVYKGVRRAIRVTR